MVVRDNRTENNNNNNKNNQDISKSLEKNKSFSLPIKSLITENQNKNEFVELEKDSKYFNENYCYLWSIANMDNKLKNMHKRWSKID